MNVTSPLTACIPAVNTVSGNRIQMALQYHRQAQMLKRKEYPLLTSPAIRTFVENSKYYKITAKENGQCHIVNRRLIIEYESGKIETLFVEPYMQLFVENKQYVTPGTLIAMHQNIDLKKGIAFGVHLNVAFTNKYTFEDSIMITESARKKLTSIHFKKMDIPINKKYFRINTDLLQIGNTIQKGDDLLYLYKSHIDFLVSPSHIEFAEESGTIIHIEMEMFDDTYKTDSTEFIKKYSIESHYDKSILSEAVSLEIQKNEFRKESDKIGVIRIYLTEEKETKIGDKLTNRYGNKGIISEIIPDDEAWKLLRKEFNVPKEFDWFTPEIFLNPLGIPRRMNPTQLAEFALLYICKYTIPRYIKSALQQNQSYTKILSTIIENVHKILSKPYYMFVKNELQKIANQPDSEQQFKLIVDDIMRYGLTLELDPFVSDYLLKVSKIVKIWDPTYYELLTPEVGKGCSIGSMYTIKVEQMVDTKLKAISTETYSIKTKQPLNGQRIGEMEMTTLIAYDIPSFMFEVLKPRSDEHVSKAQMFDKLAFEGTCSINDIDDRESRMTRYLKSLLKVIDVEI